MFAVRLVGFYEDAESYRDTVETTKYGVSPSVMLKFSDESQLSYELELSHQELPFDRGVIAIDGELGLIPESRFLGEPGYGPVETDALGHQVELQQELSDNWSALIGFNFRDTSLEGYASENGFGAPDDEGNFGRFTRFRDYDAKYQMFRAELSGSFDIGGLENRVIVGIDADEFENDQYALRDRTTDQSINIFNPVYGNYPISSLTLPVQIDRVEVQESVGLYVQDQISLTDKLDIRFGARFDDYNQVLNNRRSGTVSEYSKTEVSPQFGLVYQFTDAFSLYTVYGENFRPLSGATEDNNLDPNESTSTELGIKFSLNEGALQGTVAVFDVEQSNISTVDADFAATAIGEAGSQGLEIDLNGELSDSLSILASYAYIDAETKNAYNDPNFGTEVPAGSNLINIPEHSFSLQLVQQMLVFEKELDLIGGVIYVDDRNGFFCRSRFRIAELHNGKSCS